MIKLILNLWSRLETLLIGVLLIMALGVFLSGGALRVFAPQYAVDWTTEVALYFMIWATVIAGVAILPEHRHLSAEIFVAMLPQLIRRGLGWVISIVALVFVFVVLLYGWHAYEFSNLLDERSASSLRLPQGIPVFLALPVGMGLILLRAGLMILDGQQPFSAPTDTDEVK